MATRNANLKEREESTEASEANGEEKRGWPRERKKERKRETFLHRVEIELEVEK